MSEDKVPEGEQTITVQILVVLFKNHRLWEEFAVMIKLHVVIKMYFEV